MNAFDETRIAVDRAKLQMRAADACADDMARILRGRLRHVRPWNLEALKRELREFNMHTKEWKS